MTTNADITIYHKYVDPGTRLDAYDRHTVSQVLWEACKAVNVIKSGMAESDAFRVYIPFAHMGSAEVQAGDIIIRGFCEKDIGPDFTVRDLQQQYQAMFVTSVDKKDYGSPALWHYEIGGK